MPLKDFRVRASIAVSDIQRAVRFYEGMLGSTAVHAGPSADIPDGSRVYESATTITRMTPAPARTSDGTPARPPARRPGRRPSPHPQWLQALVQDVSSYEPPHLTQALAA